MVEDVDVTALAEGADPVSAELDTLDVANAGSCIEGDAVCGDVDERTNNEVIDAEPCGNIRIAGARVDVAEPEVAEGVDGDVARTGGGDVDSVVSIDLELTGLDRDRHAFVHVGTDTDETVGGNTHAQGAGYDLSSHVLTALEIDDTAVRVAETSPKYAVIAAYAVDVLGQFVDAADTDVIAVEVAASIQADCAGRADLTVEGEDDIVVRVEGDLTCLGHDQLCQNDVAILIRDDRATETGGGQADGVSTRDDHCFFNDDTGGADGDVIVKDRVAATHNAARVDVERTGDREQVIEEVLGAEVTVAEVSSRFVVVNG